MNGTHPSSFDLVPSFDLYQLPIVVSGTGATLALDKLLKVM